MEGAGSSSSVRHRSPTAYRWTSSSKHTRYYLGLGKIRGQATFHQELCRPPRVPREQLDCPSLRASNEHLPSVRVLRAQEINSLHPPTSPRCELRLFQLIQGSGWPIARDALPARRWLRR